MAEMMPPSLIHRAGMTRIIGSGGGLCRNPVLETLVKQEYVLIDQTNFNLYFRFNLILDII